MKIIAITVALLAGIWSASAQRVGFAYWNVDRLYDTEASPFCDDEAFTPEGRYGWTEERYRRKVNGVAAVADSMAMPVTVLYGVENEAVVRDIAAACTLDYSYLHRTIDSHGGLDFALLYFGDVLLPQRTESDGRNVAVHCTVAGRRMVLVLSRDGVRAHEMAGRIRRDDPSAAVMIMGRCDAAAAASCGLADTFAGEERAGRGAGLRGGVWSFDERICVDTLLDTRAAVYARRRLFDRRGRAPLPTFTGARYTGGVSRWLPLTVIAEWRDESGR